MYKSEPRIPAAVHYQSPGFSLSPSPPGAFAKWAHGFPKKAGKQGGCIINCANLFHKNRHGSISVCQNEAAAAKPADKEIEPCLNTCHSLEKA